MKKVLRTLSLVAVAGSMLTACGAKNTGTKVDVPEAPVTQVKNLGLKVGLITLHDEQSTYDKNFIDALNDSATRYGLTTVVKTGIPEGNECYTAAKELAQAGCDVIFADSFGHEPYVKQAAQEFPNVEFCHATGTQAHTSGLTNFHNAFASIYEGRYLAGVVAGMRLQSMMAADSKVQPVVGYVGAWQYAEVKSGYTSWFLGVQSVVPTATMKVQFTSSWYDEQAEKSAAENLIAQGCVLISQHADSWGAPTACEAAGVPNVSYNGSTASKCPETFLVSSRINWSPYYEYVCDKVAAGETFDSDYVGTIATGSVELTEFGENVAPKTQSAVLKAASALANGSLHVFDTSKFTVGGEHLTSYMADVDDAGDYVGETEVISDGYFHESEYRSAPYFDLEIDGIDLLNSGFGA